MKRILVLAALAAAALAAAAVALAGNITATATVSGAGSIGLSHGGSATVGPVTLDGTDQSVNYTLPLSITDARGSGAGTLGTPARAVRRAWRRCSVEPRPAPPPPGRGTSR